MTAALVQLSRDTATAQIQAAVDAAGDPGRIQDARDELAKGDTELAKGEPDRAADKYKKAWEHATDALDDTGRLPADASLWVVDDVARTTANVTLSGQRTTSFATPNTAISSVSVDPLDGTLWGVNEGGAAGAGKLVNYDTTGAVIREIPAGTFGGFGGEGMSIAPGPDGSLWVVDDPDVTGRVDTVYRVARDGTLLDSFPTSTFSTGSTSPQDIAYDTHDGTLWITDNGADRVYNITTTGQLVRSFPTDAGRCPLFAASTGG